MGKGSVKTLGLSHWGCKRGSLQALYSAKMPVKRLKVKGVLINDLIRSVKISYLLPKCYNVDVYTLTLFSVGSSTQPLTIEAIMNYVKSHMPPMTSVVVKHVGWSLCTCCCQACLAVYTNLATSTHGLMVSYVIHTCIIWKF